MKNLHLPLEIRVEPAVQHLAGFRILKVQALPVQPGVALVVLDGAGNRETGRLEEQLAALTWNKAVDIAGGPQGRIGACHV